MSFARLTTANFAARDHATRRLSPSHNAKLPPRALILTPETCRVNRARLSDSRSPVPQSAPRHSEPAVAVGHVKCLVEIRREHQAEAPSRAESELPNDLELFIDEDCNDAETPVELRNTKSSSPEVTRAVLWYSSDPHELYNASQDVEVPGNAKTLHAEPELDEGYIPSPEKDPDKT
ncbi:uncharacterized protein EI90DRAFT_3078312, partial [Cantharellus anzutake]|uniref:uncharacterized protein n=1 Tax=Cantharellus anzutake TaxID=1750568 RepID=UPI00190751A0